MEDANTQSGNPRARTKPPAEATQNPHLAGGVEMDGSHAFTLDQRRAAFSENNEEAVYAQGGSTEHLAGTFAKDGSHAFTEAPQGGGVRHKVLTGIGVALCVFLIPIVIINCTLIVKQALNKDEVPSVGGIFPMIVLTDSMAGTFNAGSLIVCGQVSAEDVRAGDIICFFDPSGNGTTTTTHRVQEVKNEGGEISFVTKGDANNTADSKPVPADKLVGRYIFHIEGLGSVAMFMQTTPGLIIFAVLPILVLVAYDVLRRRAWDRKKDSETDALVAELAALRAQREAQVAGVPYAGQAAQTGYQWEQPSGVQLGDAPGGSGIYGQQRTVPSAQASGAPADTWVQPSAPADTWVQANSAPADTWGQPPLPAKPMQAMGTAPVCPPNNGQGAQAPSPWSAQQQPPLQWEQPSSMPEGTVAQPGSAPFGNQGPSPVQPEAQTPPVWESPAAAEPQTQNPRKGKKTGGWQP